MLLRQLLRCQFPTIIDFITLNSDQTLYPNPNLHLKPNRNSNYCIKLYLCGNKLGAIVAGANGVLQKQIIWFTSSSGVIGSTVSTSPCHANT